KHPEENPPPPLNAIDVKASTIPREAVTFPPMRKVRRRPRTIQIDNAVNTRHPGMLKKLLDIAIDALSNKDITGAFLNLLSEILTLFEGKETNKTPNISLRSFLK
ncbi:hypothetical protein ILUMI_27417, partial [Ignelater luminosus]